MILSYHFPDDESKSRRDIFVSDSLDRKIKIEILPARLAQQSGLREHQVQLGVGLLDPALNIGVSIYYNALYY